MFSRYNLKHGFCLYLYDTQQVGSSSAKITGNEELETVFRLFWNNINQQMMDNQFFFIRDFSVYRPHSPVSRYELSRSIAVV
jgi:hypothetical protein